MPLGSCLRGNDNADAVSPVKPPRLRSVLQPKTHLLLSVTMNSLHGQITEQEGEFGSQFCAFSPWFVGSLLSACVNRVRKQSLPWGGQEAEKGRLWLGS